MELSRGVNDLRAACYAFCIAEEAENFAILRFGFVRLSEFGAGRLKKFFVPPGNMTNL
jgi:hypothetical protein